METSFILSCESTIDLPYSYCEARGIPVLFYSYQVDGVSYEDDMGRDPAALPRFYGFLDEGKLPTTAQLNEFQYESFFDALLQPLCRTLCWPPRACGKNIRSGSSS